MVNAWSLAYDVINGTLDENFPIMTDKNRVTPQESDEYDPKPKSESEDTDWKDPVITVGSGSTDSAVFVDFNLNDQIDTISIDTSNYETLDLTGIELPSGMSIDQEYVTGIETPTPGIQNPCNRDRKSVV